MSRTVKYWGTYCIKSVRSIKHKEHFNGVAWYANYDLRNSLVPVGMFEPKPNNTIYDLIKSDNDKRLSRTSRRAILIAPSTARESQSTATESLMNTENKGDFAAWNRGHKTASRQAINERYKKQNRAKYRLNASEIQGSEHTIISKKQNLTAPLTITIDVKVIYTSYENIQIKIGKRNVSRKI
jgi:hypothetical protein